MDDKRNALRQIEALIRVRPTFSNVLFFVHSFFAGSQALMFRLFDTTNLSRSVFFPFVLILADGFRVPCFRKVINIRPCLLFRGLSISALYCRSSRYALTRYWEVLTYAYWIDVVVSFWISTGLCLHVVKTVASLWVIGEPLFTGEPYHVFMMTALPSPFRVDVPVLSTKCENDIRVFAHRTKMKQRPLPIRSRCAYRLWGVFCTTKRLVISAASVSFSDRNCCEKFYGQQMSLSEKILSIKHEQTS